MGDVASRQSSGKPNRSTSREPAGAGRPGLVRLVRLVRLPWGMPDEDETADTDAIEAHGYAVPRPTQ